MVDHYNLLGINVINDFTELDLHTNDFIISLIYIDNESYFYLKDTSDKIKDVCNMPSYIKKDWVNYNKSKLCLSEINKHIKFLDNFIKGVHINSIEDQFERLNNLKSIRRSMIIAGII